MFRKDINAALDKHMKVVTVVVDKPAVIVIAEFQNGSKKKKFTGYGWSVWGITDVKATADYAKRIKQEEKQVEENIKYWIERGMEETDAREMCSWYLNDLKTFKAKVEWNEESGIKKATARARQQLFHKLMAEIYAHQDQLIAELQAEVMKKDELHSYSESETA